MMSRRSFGCLAIAALAVATVFVATDPASAQFRRGRIYYPAYSESYVPSYSVFSTDYYSSGIPSYYGDGTETFFSTPFTGATIGSYGAFSGAVSNNQALINVRVPFNAEV